jgi:hypothetical protein
MSHGILPGVPEEGDQFGYALEAADLIGGGNREHLIVGLPFDDDGSRPDDSGAVTTLDDPGNSGPIRKWTLSSTGLSAGAGEGDLLGLLITVGDFTGDGRLDLALPIPFRDVDGVTDAGAVQVLYTRNTLEGGLSAEGNQFWTQDSPSVADAAEVGDNFGWLPLP